jgi:LacI family transcriptional regulator
MAARHRPAVALLIETSNSYARGLVEGILTYVRQHDHWSIHLPESHRGARPPSWLARWKGDGIIARIETPAIAKAVADTKLPVVDVSAARHLPNIPWVETDDQAIADIAADHLMSRGFRELAFCGDRHFNWAILRCEHFVRIVQRSGGKCHVYESSSAGRSSDSAWDREQQRLTRWVASLPRPVGIMTCYDIRAQQLLDVCRELNIAVPEEIAVIGVDNDRLLCDLCEPPLSSVMPDTHRTGFIAASLLDKQMSGEKVAPQAYLIPPLGVQTRRSTDIMAIDDPHIAGALRFIRENACSGIQIRDLLREIPLSRRVLESRFKQRIGRTPHEEIMRIRMERVKILLVETDLPLRSVAKRTGFNYIEYLNEAFKKYTGTTPGKYRKEASAGRPLGDGPPGRNKPY